MARLVRRSVLTVGGAMLVVLGGCQRGPADRVITSQRCILSGSGSEFILEPAIRRRFNSGSVVIKLVESFVAEPPWTAIRLSDGRVAKVSVALTALDGRTFSGKIIGSCCGGVEVRFDPEVPRDAAIRVVRISSTIPLPCHSVAWHDYDAE